MVTPDDDRLTALTIEDVETPALLSLVWRPAHSPAVRRLVEHSRQTFAGAPPRPA